MKQVKACMLVPFLAALLVACAPQVTTVMVTVAPQVTPRMVTATPAPTIAPTPTNTPSPRIKRHEGVNVLLLLPDHYGANYYLNKDNFELFGWDVTVAGVEQTIGPCTSFAAQHGCRAVAVDVLISDVADITAYDVLAIMPSTRFTSGRGSDEPYGDLLESQEALDLIVSAVEEGLVVYAPCAGVRVLAAADVINGKNVTGRSQFKDEYLAASATYIGGSPPPVIDDNIVTAMRGLYYHVQNCQAVATSLESVPIEYVVEEKEEAILSDAIAQDGAVWTRTFGGSNSEGGRAIAETSDGGFIIAGYTYSFGAGNADVYLIKTGSDGNVIWSKAFGGPGWEYGFSVSETDDGGYIVTGYTSSDGAGSKDVYLIKTDSAGNEVWTKTFGGSGPEMGGSVDETSDGGFVIVGASGSYSDNSDVYLVKTNPEGNEVWSTTVSHPSAHLNYDWGNSVRETNDGGYIIAGNSDLERDLMDVYLIKTDSEGNAVWAQAFGERFYDYGSSVRETSDGGYIVSGATKSAVTGQNDVYVRKVDSEGKEVWTRTFGSDTGSEWGSAICETGDGDYVIVGHTDSYGAGSYDVWLIRVGRGEIETG